LESRAVSGVDRTIAPCSGRRRHSAVWAQADVRKILATIGANVIDDEVPVGQAHEAFDDEGGLIDPELRARLAGIVTQLAGEARPGAEMTGQVARIVAR